MSKARCRTAGADSKSAASPVSDSALKRSFLTLADTSSATVLASSHTLGFVIEVTPFVTTSNEFTVATEACSTGRREACLTGARKTPRAPSPRSPPPRVSGGRAPRAPHTLWY
ncbi:hypothetical protein GWK47_010828 [Chionoecetes opilio]|uniref:Uncharacterized protein n=1 Tax=Chionoecetes opilio TaxID=41210 RepID=A0A8J5CMJ9_CHIOP|nr:hypothetical protein GWK47_010828 [Chionoecetes opilio]